MQKVVFFTKYTTKGPTSRYRTYQYQQFINQHFQTVCLPFFDDEYIDGMYQHKKKNVFKLLKYVLKRIFYVMTKLWTKDLIVIEYELIPYFPSFFEKLLKWTGVKYILNYDDAIFDNYENSKHVAVRFLLKNKIKNIAKGAAHIITGSPYLTSYFEKYNANVTELPTSITFKYYLQHKKDVVSDKFVIGWLGSTSTSVNLLKLKELIAEMNITHSNVVFRFCGFDTRLEKHFGSNVEFITWSTENEMKFLNEINVGIMPLEDNLFNRGKCGFKLIQYMAMGKPTISTPLEANVKINRENGNLFATTAQEWRNAFCKMIQNPEEFKQIGKLNAEIVEKYYAIEQNSKVYVELLKNTN